MKKLAISLAITSALGLTACDDTTLADVQEQSKATIEKNLNESKRVRVVFDPSNKKLSVPNDFLFSGTTDLTLEMPDEVADKMAGNGLASDVDWSNPSAVLGALDGWGAQNAFTIELEYDDGTSIDASTVASGDAVALYQVITYPELSVEGCEDSAMANFICKGVEKLTFGEDYIATVVGGNIAVIPLKPLKAGASYAVALTKSILDSKGNELLPSSTYAAVEVDMSVAPIVSPSIAASDLTEAQKGIQFLQALTNNFENKLAEAPLNADKTDIVYTQVFSVQSAGVPTTDPLQIAKLLNAQAFNALPQEQKATVVMPTMVSDRQMTAADALAAAGRISADPTDSTNLLFQTAHVHSTTISVPYYLEDETGNPLTGRWEAACDSGVILAQMTPEQLGAAAANAGDNHTMCGGLGLADLGVDVQRHLTKYNPVADVKSMQSIGVQVTTPNVDVANLILASKSMDPIAKGDDGWPVVILQHGITSKKEDMLAITGALSLAGFATVAIDHPLHGSRGFTLTSTDAEGNEVSTTINASSGFGGKTTDYLNLSSLLTARDNLRQSAADSMHLRLLLNGFITPADLMGDTTFDASNVHYLGHSLGAITGTVMTAVANSPVSLPPMEGVPEEIIDQMEEDLASAYTIKSTVLASPGSSIANFLAESGSFGDLVQASVVYGAGNELSAALAAKLQPAEFMEIIAANPAECGPAVNQDTGAVVDQGLALVCAYKAFKQEATPEQQAGIASSVSQFAFAAQAALEAGDPSNYSQLLKVTQTPVLVYEVVGDGDTSLSDQVIPNTVSTDPKNQIGGTTGLTYQLGLESVTQTTGGLGNPVSGVVRFTYGTHSSILSPAQDEESLAVAPNALKNAAVNIEMQNMAAGFFKFSGGVIPVSGSVEVGDVSVTCIIENAANCTGE